MGSFTDAIHQFNPYIQQLPVEDMARVGMYKQQQYDQGVEKIQSYIDNIAGLDVARGVDKQYLQSKFDELGGNLKKVAGGDFSNHQLVNSVGGMTKQIIRDNKVQSAVQSTSLYRKNLKEIEDDEKAGKSNVNNTNKFYKDASAWLNGKEAGELLGASYFKPVDVWGKIKDIAKEVAIDESDVQQIYQTDANNNRIPEYNSKKQIVGYKWNPVMVEKITKGKDPAKILNAFKSALTSSDYKQLAIDGEMGKAHYTPQMLKDEIVENSRSQMHQVDEQLLMLDAELINQSSNNVKDDAVIASLSKQKEYYQTLKSNLESSIESSLKAVDTNPDAVRSSLWTNSYLTSMSKQLSGRSVSEKYSVNPLFTVTMEQNKFNRELQRDAVADRKWQMDYNLKLQKELSDEEKYKLELFYKYGIKTPGLKLPETDDKDLSKEPISPETDPTYVKNQVADEYGAKISEVNERNKKITFEYFKKRNPNLSETEINKAIYKLATGNRESVDVTSGDINTFTARFAAKQIADWGKTGKGVPKEFLAMIAKQNEELKNIDVLSGRIKSIQKQALADLKEKGIKISSKEDILKSINNIQTTDANGVPMTISKQDILDYAIMEEVKDLERNQIYNRLSLKYGKNFDKFKITMSESLGDTGAVVTNKEYKKARDSIKNSNYKELSRIESQLYLNSGMIKQPVSLPVSRGTGEGKELINSIISDVVSKYRGNNNESEGFDEPTFQKILLSNDPNAIRVVTQFGVTDDKNKHILSLIDSKTGKHLEVTIDNDQYERITKRAALKASNIPKVLEQLNYNNRTNHSESEDPSTSWWKATDFKSLDPNVNYTLGADLVPDKEDKNQTWLKIYQHMDSTTAEYKKGDSLRIYIAPKPFSKYNQDGTTNMFLDRIPEGITSSSIESLKKIK
jgi:hypothetical protein